MGIRSSLLVINLMFEQIKFNADISHRSKVIAIIRMQVGGWSPT